MQTVNGSVTSLEAPQLKPAATRVTWVRLQWLCCLGIYNEHFNGTGDRRADHDPHLRIIASRSVTSASRKSVCRSALHPTVGYFSGAAVGGCTLGFDRYAD